MVPAHHERAVGQAFRSQQPRIGGFTLLAVVDHQEQAGPRRKLREFIAEAEASVDMTATAAGVRVIAATHGETIGAGKSDALALDPESAKWGLNIHSSTTWLLSLLCTRRKGSACEARQTSKSVALARLAGQAGEWAQSKADCVLSYDEPHNFS